jgi:F0F1-type ATP synthase membrane subunit a
VGEVDEETAAVADVVVAAAVAAAAAAAAVAALKYKPQPHGVLAACQYYVAGVQGVAKSTLLCADLYE